MQLTVPIVAILRGVEAGFFGELMHAAFAAGLQAIEITINTANAEKIVAKQRLSVPAGRFLGMGTVRNINEAKRAVAAGAMFLVSPNFDGTVIEFARTQGVPIIAGALTPTEVFSAWSAGADMVKVFPCGALGGPKYIKNLRGPFDQIKLVAVGGVTQENVRQYLDAGAAAVGIGAGLFGRNALLEKDVSAAVENLEKFIADCAQGYRM